MEPIRMSSHIQLDVLDDKDEIKYLSYQLILIKRQWKPTKTFIDYESTSLKGGVRNELTNIKS